jgi:hypothetical protein
MSIVEATTSLPFHITDKHQQLARSHRNDKSKCVVSQGLKSNRDILEAEVGAAVTLVTFTSGKQVRYRTPAVLREGLMSWDRTGKWELPSGTYFLQAPRSYETKKSIRKNNKAFKQRQSSGIVLYNVSGKGNTPAVNARNIEYNRRKSVAA